MLRRRSSLTIVIVGFAAVLAGCSSTESGSGSAGGTAAGSGTPASSRPAASASPTSRSAGHSRRSSHRPSPVRSPSTPASHPVTPQCTNDIRVIPQGGQGAAGHLSLVLVFNNVSTTTTCEIVGYPGVDLVDDSGATVVHLTRTLRGMAGGEPPGVTAPQPVILAPGQSASALAEASDVPQGGISDCGSYALLITVPNQYASVSGGTAMLPKCAAEIHPVVPGTTGGAN